MFATVSHFYLSLIFTDKPSSGIIHTLKCQTRVEEADVHIHTSLTYYTVDYCCKKFYSYILYYLYNFLYPSTGGRIRTQSKDYEFRILPLRYWAQAKSYIQPCLMFAGKPSSAIVHTLKCQNRVEEANSHKHTSLTYCTVNYSCKRFLQ